MFLERLGQVRAQIAGAEALCLVDGDGLAIESVNTAPDLDLELLAAEMVSQLRTLADQLEEIAPGRMRHYTVATGARTLMVSSVADGYYLLLVLGPQGSHGRARFELRRAGLLLEPDLD